MVEDSVVSIYFVFIKRSLCGSSKRWVITGVYVPTNGNSLSDFLAKLEGGGTT